MFIPSDQRHMYRHTCEHCISCRWCYTRRLRNDAFRIKDGPGDFFFCDTDCSSKWCKYRHVVGLAHIVKMPADLRQIALEGRTIDEYIARGVVTTVEHTPGKRVEKFLLSE